MSLKTKQRSRMTIVSDILSTARNGARRTQIMHAVFLSFDQLNRYMSLLVDRGLMEKEAQIIYDHSVVTYKTTELGRQFLDRYSQLQDILLLSEIGA